MDQLKRAWDLLEPGERPEGMGYDPESECTPWLHTEPSTGATYWITGTVAYDRLCQAVEWVNLSLGLMLDKGVEKYYWTTKMRDDNRLVAEHPDRLTAACNALEAERGGGRGVWAVLVL